MIYFFDRDPKIASDCLLLRHLSPQMCFCSTILSSALHKKGYSINQKPLAKPNTLVDWATSKENFNWVVNYLRNIQDRFVSWRGKEHKTSLDLKNLRAPSDFSDEPFYPFPIDIQLHLFDDQYLNYQKAYISKIKDSEVLGLTFDLGKLNQGVPKTLFYFCRYNRSFRLMKLDHVFLEELVGDNWEFSSLIEGSSLVLVEELLKVCQKSQI